jgi:transcriptional regulator with XRE-family HTH domain
MQDLRKIGAFISQLRRTQNWTQLELADRLSVTHQAVSRWETGSSLPDIETLVHLAQLFNVQVDDVLNGAVQPRGTDAQKATLGDVLTALAQQHPEHVARMVSEQRADIESVIEAGPLTPPATMDRLITALEGFPFHHEQIQALAPFLSQEILRSLLLRAEAEAPQPELAGQLAPFLDSATLDQLMRGVAGAALEAAYLQRLGPFLSQETLHWLLMGDGRDPEPERLGQLAPFLDTATLAQLVQRIADGALDLPCLQRIAPFLSAEMHDTLISASADDASSRIVHTLAPFLDTAQRDQLVTRIIDGSLDGELVMVLAPFLSQEGLLRLIKSDPTGEHKRFAQLAPFLAQETILQILHVSSAGQSTTKLPR